MRRFAPYARRGALPLIVAALCVRMMGDRAVEASPATRAFSDAIPQTVVWAWEEPEDLRGADAHSVGVAYLAETILLGGEVAVRHRHQPLAVADGAAVMAVVRIEAQAGFRDSPELREQTAGELAAVSRRTGLRALQVDFDATRSERAFYTGVLRAVRPQMPAGMPLSITALASWCAVDGRLGSREDWLAGLPIDEAVPMFFRLGGHAKAYGDKSSLTVREPLCRGSIGLSTDESWPMGGIITVPAQATAQRVYLFSPRPWRPAQLTAVVAVPSGERADVLRVGDDQAHASRGINDTGLHPAGHTLEDMR
jgi:Protein of unknown function (DUF3142)